MKTIYLDNAATTKMSTKVIEGILKSYEENYGNPSSTHRLGQKSKGLLEKARGTIAKKLEIENSEIIFTSGGAEGNNLILKGVAKFYKNKGKHIITTKIEHSSVLETCKDLEKVGFEVTYLDVDKNGVINIEDLRKKLRDDTIIVSIMFVNNETGVKQPIKEIGELLKDRDILFHTDGVQIVGKETFNLKKLNIGAFTATAHKFYGPKGVGFLFLDKKFSLEKEISGGKQERNRRGGTENLNGIIGMEIALEEIYESLESEMVRERELLEYLEKRVKEEIENVEINGENKERIGSISNITVKGCDIQTLLIALDMRGICVSGGSACMSGAMENSHVLEAMGKSQEELKGSFRVSIGKYTTREEIDYFVDNLKEVVEIERNC